MVCLPFLERLRPFLEFFEAELARRVHVRLARIGRFIILFLAVITHVYLKNFWIPSRVEGTLQKKEKSPNGFSAIFILDNREPPLI